MVVQWIMAVVFDAVNWMLTHMGTISLPSFFGTGDGSIAGLFGNLVGALEAMGNWIPVEAIGPCLEVLLATVTVCFGIRVVRIIISHLTGGGGSAA